MKNSPQAEFCHDKVRRTLGVVFYCGRGHNFAVRGTKSVNSADE